MRANTADQIEFVFGSRASDPRQRLRTAAEQLSDDVVRVLATVAERLHSGLIHGRPTLSASDRADPLGEACEEILDLTCDACMSLQRLARGAQ